MTDLDQRLHHAARRLREMPVDTPPLASLGIADLPVPPAPPQARAHQPAARVPAGIAAALLVVGGIVGFGIGHRQAADVAVEREAVPAPTAADRMRDPIVRLAAISDPAAVPRRQVRWS